MTGLAKEVLAALSSDHLPPCLSLYQPTHRRHPENQQDPIRYRNLVKELEASLRQEYPTAETRRLLEPFEALGHDSEFWNHTLDGLVVLGGPGVSARSAHPRAPLAAGGQRWLAVRWSRADYAQRATAAA